MDDVSIKSGSTTSSKRVGLSLSIQKQLALDIEGLHGGASSLKKGGRVSISNFLDNREDLYGRKGSDLRRRVSRKAYRWLALSDREYQEKVIDTFHIKKNETEKTTNPQLKRKAETSTETKGQREQQPNRTSTRRQKTEKQEEKVEKKEPNNKRVALRERLNDAELDQVLELLSAKTKKMKIGDPESLGGKFSFRNLWCCYR